MAKTKTTKRKAKTKPSVREGHKARREQRLSQKQFDFVNHYAVHENASAAAMKAGYSSRTARMQGHKLLTRDYIQEAVAKKREKLRAETERRGMPDKMEIVQILCNMIELDPNELGTISKGMFKVRDSDKIPKKVRQLIDSIENTQSGVKVKMSTKLEAIKVLSKLLGWDVDRSEITFVDPVKVVLPDNGR